VQGIQELYVRYEPILKPLLRIGPIFGGVALLAWRVRETRVPVTRKAIIIPPVAMSTGFGMFFAPMMRVPLTWALMALVSGAVLLAWPLLRSTRLEPRNGVIYMQRSRAFLAILLVLLAMRIGLHDYIGHLISPLQTAAIFYLLAFGMIVRWRLAMYNQFTALTAQTAKGADSRTALTAEQR
jgi:membrane protein CcdC involved in cytochrome C biogenesis